MASSDSEAENANPIASGVVHAGSKRSILDRASDYYLHPSDHPGLSICPVILKGENYQEWSTVMKNAFRAKRKMGFLDGRLLKPPSGTIEEEDWFTVNSMLIGWIIQSIDPKLRSSITYYNTVRDLWEDLKQRFSVRNGPRIFQLRFEIAQCRQQGQAVDAYYGKLQKLWAELLTYVPPKACACGSCTCQLSTQLLNEREEERIHQFLMGLDDDVFGTVRSNILARDPLPNLNGVYALIVQEQSHMSLIKTRDANLDAMAFSAQSKSGDQRPHTITNFPKWKNMASDILSNLAKLLNSDVDNLRLRSVCSSWRSSLPPPYKPFSFPLKLPPLSSPSDIPFYQLLQDEGVYKAEELIGEFILNEITLYRLSPPSDSDTDDDSSNGWILKVSTQANSNAFTLLNPVTMEKMEDPIPKQVNLLDYGISEIGKCHNVEFTGGGAMMLNYKKVIALWNYFTDCDFGALVLKTNGSMKLWKLGDDKWTPIDTMIDDVILFQGKCYAVNNGVLFYLDSELKMTVVASSHLSSVFFVNLCMSYLVECKSDLYVVWYIGYDPERIGGEIYQAPSKLGLEKFNECNGSLDSVEDLKDVFFILSAYASHGFSAKDFAGFKENRVYVNDECFALEHGFLGNMVGVYCPGDSGKEISPPNWLHI